MYPRIRLYTVSRPVIITACLALSPSPALAATAVMNQSCPGFSNWSNTTCWQGGILPVSGNDVVIQSPAPGQTNYDLGAGVQLHSITLTSAGTSVTITGGPIVLASGGSITDNFNNAGLDAFPGITLNGPVTF